MNVYIAGPMSEYRDYNYDWFVETAEQIKAVGGHPVHTANLPRGLTYSDYIKFSAELLEQCDAIFLSRTHFRSAGAKVEMRIAMDLGLKIFHEMLGIEQVREWVENSD